VVSTRFDVTESLADYGYICASFSKSSADCLTNAPSAAYNGNPKLIEGMDS